MVQKYITGSNHISSESNSEIKGQLYEDLGNTAHEVSRHMQVEILIRWCPGHACLFATEISETLHLLEHCAKCLSEITNE